MQMSLNRSLDLETHFNLRVALEKFRDQGILIIGSGMSFHNMHGYSQPNFGPISDAFDQWLVKTFEPNIARRNQDFFWENAPAARLCHPTGQEEHLLPLMIVVGAASKELGYEVFSDGVLKPQYLGLRLDLINSKKCIN